MDLDRARRPPPRQYDPRRRSRASLRRIREPGPRLRDPPELAACYAAASGRDLSELDFYLALGYWKLAIILEGVLARMAAGGYGKVGADPSGVEAFAHLVHRLAETADAVEARGS
jgi:aminoglycoside phosphotransferase (APT) family kinase protein